MNRVKGQLMIRTVICEDEAHTRAYLAALVCAQPYDCEIVEYASAEDCLADDKTPDLLFLDIGLQPSGAGGTDNTDGAGSARGDGMDGMALARKLRARYPAKRPVIVFVTGYAQYVFDAFDVGAFHYLLKPVDEKKFAGVFARAAEEILLAGQDTQAPRVLTLRIGNTGRTVPIDEIRYIESSGHKAMLHLGDGTLACYTKLGDLEQKLQGRFFRIHKGYLVNLSYITGYTRSEVMLSGGQTLLLSKYKYRDFVKAYLRFL